MSSCVLLLTVQHPEWIPPSGSPNVTLPEVIFFQGGASNKSTFVNVRHRIRQIDACQRPAIYKGILLNVCDRLTQSNARKRKADPPM